MPIEKRTFELCELRLEPREGKPPLIRGLAVPYNKLSVDLGGFRERFMPGAFGDLEGRDVVALWSHNSAEVLGRTPKTLKLEDRKEGVRVVIDPPAAATARIETIERGDIRGMSFAFIVPPGGDRILEIEEQLIREVVEAELIEVSPVAFPAYPDTDVKTAMRSVDHWREEQQKATAEEIRFRHLKRRQQLAEIA